MISNLESKHIKKKDCFVIRQNFPFEGKPEVKSQDLICIQLGIKAFEDMFEKRMDVLVPHIDEEATAVVTKLEPVKMKYYDTTNEDLEYWVVVEPSTVSIYGDTKKVGSMFSGYRYDSIAYNC